MQKKTVVFVAFLWGSFTSLPVFAQVNTLYDQLVYVNNEWKNQPDLDPALKKLPSRQLNEQQLIQQHLYTAEDLIRKRQVHNLPATLQKNRQHNLDVLHQYANAGMYPVNTMHLARQPYFIDEYNTYCAVGYLMKESGAGSIARGIQKTQNYSYLKDIDNPELLQWAAKSGLSLNELALIQPGYVNDRPAALLEFHYNNTGADVGEYIEFQQPVGIMTFGPVDSIFFYNQNNILYKKLAASQMQSIGGGVYSYGFPANEDFSDKGKMELRSNTGVVSTVINYDDVSVTTTTYQNFNNPVIKQYPAGENETTAVGTSLTFCGQSFGFGNTNLTLQSIAATPGVVNPCVLLPVSLSAFTHTITHNQVTLFWETASETNTRKFEIERSSTGMNFDVIGTLPAAGNSSNIRKYTFKDPTPGSINHYRLKQVDRDGKFIYSQMLFVKVATASSLAVLQKIVQADLAFSISGSAGGTIEIYDFAGKKVFASVANTGIKHLNVSGWNAGKYIIRLLTTDGQVYSQPFIKH